MKTIAIIITLITLLLAAGCVSQSGPGTSPATVPQADALPMDGHMVHTTPNTTFDVWIDSFEMGEIQENGDQALTIYIAAKNTGTKPIRMTWFSQLTDVNGKTYGGIGISHGGNGARSSWIQPNMTEAARDYVTVRSDRDLATLSKGAVLDVYFMEKPLDNVPVGEVPDYHTRWTVDAGILH